MQFEKGTFGTPLSQAAKDKHIKEMYGSHTSAQPLLLESALLLDLPDKDRPNGLHSVPPTSKPQAPAQRNPAASLAKTNRLGPSQPQNQASKPG